MLAFRFFLSGGYGLFVVQIVVLVVAAINGWLLLTEQHTETSDEKKARQRRMLIALGILAVCWIYLLMIKP